MVGMKLIPLRATQVTEAVTASARNKVAAERPLDRRFAAGAYFGVLLDPLFVGQFVLGQAEPPFRVLAAARLVWLVPAFEAKSLATSTNHVLGA